MAAHPSFDESAGPDAAAAPGDTVASAALARPRAGARDLRLDFFRGMALWLIFIDHVPSSRIADWTLRNFGFSDATEIFVFIAGYSSYLVYSRLLRQSGFGFMSATVLRRCWQLYIAHVVLCVCFVAQIAYVAAHFDNPMYIEELNVARVIEHPDVALIEILLLHLRPVNLDVLPLYAALMLVAPLVIAGLSRWPTATLAASAVLYAGAQWQGWAWPVYADGDRWFFNPVGWQFLYVIGAWCAAAPAGYAALVRRRPALVGLAVAYLAFACWVALSWRYPRLEATVPDWLGMVLYPIDKTNLDPLRLAHFLAIAYLVRLRVPRDAAFMQHPLWRPMVLCGQNSLNVFCLGIYLSFAAHIVLVQYDDGMATQVLVVLAGLAAMTLLAALTGWYRGRARAAGDRPRTGETTNRR
ncbi:MAG: OpgC domain-containing protein [Burkholderiaceae bacterium]